MGNALVIALLDGLLIGFVYGIAAMGLTLIWGVMSVINLAHGAIIALGMFGTYLLFSLIGMNPYLALLVVALVGLAGGMLIYWVAIHRILNGPTLSALLATFAINMIIIGLGTAQFSTSMYNVNYNLGSIERPILMQWSRVIAALVAVAVAIGLRVFLYRTRPGKYIRAVSNNRAAAELMGIPSARVLALSFGLGTLLAATAGALIATITPFTILGGSTYQLKSFVIGVMGGLGNPVGALVGGLILGVLESTFSVFMPNTWVPVLEFMLFVLILVVRPSGLFGGER